VAEELSRSARKIQDLLTSRGAACEVVQLPASTRTAAEAAAAVGCTVAQIAKSIVFRTKRTSRPVIVVASGANRVNEATVAEYLGEAIQKADADFVRAKTGFAIGGVPPIGHAEPIDTIVDEDLMALGDVWAAAGTPNSVFKVSAANLLALTGGTLKSIK
jgi:prolyl-tRNA editing enzyme YbaK/EbsC (Cys-tRNA(Pro) deacylase)